MNDLLKFEREMKEEIKKEINVYLDSKIELEIDGINDTINMLKEENQNGELDKKIKELDFLKDDIVLFNLKDYDNYRKENFGGNFGVLDDLKENNWDLYDRIIRYNMKKELGL